MLEQDVNLSVAACASSGEQEVGLSLRELRIDEVAWAKFERRPIDERRDFRRQNEQQLRCSDLRICKDAFEQSIVRRGYVGHGIDPKVRGCCPYLSERPWRQLRRPQRAAVVLRALSPPRPERPIICERLAPSAWGSRAEKRLAPLPDPSNPATTPPTWPAPVDGSPLRATARHKKRRAHPAGRAPEACVRSGGCPVE